MYRFLMILVFCISCLYAQTVKISTGEWEPYVGEIMVDYGPSGRVVTEACRRANLKCEFEFMPWKRAWESVKLGRVHGTFIWTWSEERAEIMHASKEVIGWSRLNAFYNHLKHPDGITIETWDDFGKYLTAGVREYYQTLKLQKMGFRVHEVNNAPLAWKMLSLGRVDVVAANPLVAQREIETTIPEFQDIIKMDETILEESNMHLYFSRVHPDAMEVRNAMDRALKTMHEEGLVEKLYKEKNIRLKN